MLIMQLRNMKKPLETFREVEKLTEKPEPDLYRMLGKFILQLEKFPPARDYLRQASLTQELRTKKCFSKEA
jgi:uncharacterized protein HemY